jgi:hypothetical protein
MERDLTALAADARGVLRQHPREARRVLQTLLVDRLECAPFRAGALTGYRFAGTASYGGLLAGEAWPTNSGGPNGLPPPLARASTRNSEGGLTVTSPSADGRAGNRSAGAAKDRGDQLSKTVEIATATPRPNHWPGRWTFSNSPYPLPQEGEG